MSYYTKYLQGEKPEKTPYTVYYPHSIPNTHRNWNQDYYQVVSIDPGKVNYAFRIERRYFNGVIIPLVFDKVYILQTEVDNGGINIEKTYNNLYSFLKKYDEFYDDCHYVIIERQLPQNIQSSKVAAHTVAWFSIRLADKPLLPAIVEVSPSLKGKMLGYNKHKDGDLKKWASVTALKLLKLRNDQFSQDVIYYIVSNGDNKTTGRAKSDDLADTIVQVEALFKCWGYPTTPTNTLNNPSLDKLNTLVKTPKSCSLKITKLNVENTVNQAPIRLNIKPVKPVKLLQNTKLNIVSK